MLPSQFIDSAGRVLAELEEARIRYCEESVEDLIEREFGGEPEEWITAKPTEEWKTEKCKEMRAAYQKGRELIPDVLRSLVSGNYQPAMDIFYHHMQISRCAALSCEMKSKYELPDQLRALRAGLIWKKLHALLKGASG